MFIAPNSDTLRRRGAEVEYSGMGTLSLSVIDRTCSEAKGLFDFLCFCFLTHT